MRCLYLGGHATKHVPTYSQATTPQISFSQPRKAKNIGRILTDSASTWGEVSATSGVLEQPKIGPYITSDSRCSGGTLDEAAVADGKLKLGKNQRPPPSTSSVKAISDDRRERGRREGSRRRGDNNELPPPPLPSLSPTSHSITVSVAGLVTQRKVVVVCSENT